MAVLTPKLGIISFLNLWLELYFMEPKAYLI